MASSEEIGSTEDRREWQTPALSILIGRDDVLGAPGGFVDADCGSGTGDFVCPS